MLPKHVVLIMRIINIIINMDHIRQERPNKLKSNQIKYLFLLQVYFGPINSTLYLQVKKLTIACKTCVERILVRLNLG